jgi:hypothetical protein
LLTLYQSYLDGFDYHIWYNDNIPNGPKNVKVINIPSDTQQLLMKKVRSDNPQLDALRDEINNYLNKGLSTNGYFVRLSSTSGKMKRQ